MTDNNTRSEVRRHTDLTIPVDSEQVAATRYEPIECEGPSPALLMYVPYHKDDWITYGSYDPLNRYLASRGYEVVVADMVGTGGATGTIDEMFVAEREGEEAAEIVRWLAAQDWTTGSVGMYGKSYGGITSLAAAARRPEALEAIVPIETPYMGYRNSYTYGGLHELLTIGMDWLALMQVLDVKPRSKRDDDGDWAEVWGKRLDHVRSRKPWIFQFFDHERKDEAYWGDKDIPVGEIDVPTFAVGGFRDPYAMDTVDYYEQIDAPKRLLFGPWRHTMPHRGFEEAINFREQVSEWFDYFLKGEGSDPLDEATVQTWTEVDGRGEDGVWEGLDEWPSTSNAPEGYRVEQFDLTTDGAEPTASHEGEPLATEYEFDQTVGIESTIPYRSPVPTQDTNGDDARSLCFETDPFDRPLKLTGSGSATIRLESTSADPTVAVRLVDVAPDGSANTITVGALRASRRNGLDEDDPLEPGTEYEIEVPLNPKSYVFEDGHRLRVAISASYFPFAKPTGEHGSFVIRSAPDDPSNVRLPVQYYGEEKRDQNRIEMGDPDDSLPNAPSALTRSDVTWETTRERTGDTGSVTKEFENTLDLPHVRLNETGTYEASVESDDPSSWSATNQFEMTMEYDDEVIEVHASNSLSDTIIELQTTITRDGTRIFDETWTRMGNE
ncbi:CocE/NonD family hydrolase [Halostella pelagica]|uniref:CocE/NonD family hydrolase n=1 Tax=Halostella pelagica TaxID=2583824 RepID=UPI0010811612|nr:CocE/NonD family hydrolase [Halostella pelagica]